MTNDMRRTLRADRGRRKTAPAALFHLVNFRCGERGARPPASDTMCP